MACASSVLLAKTPTLEDNAKSVRRAIQLRWEACVILVRMVKPRCRAEFVSTVLMDNTHEQVDCVNRARLGTLVLVGRRVVCPVLWVKFLNREASALISVRMV